MTETERQRQTETETDRDREIQTNRGITVMFVQADYGAGEY